MGNTSTKLKVCPLKYMEKWIGKLHRDKILIPT
jgi:hypothetical protein